MTGLLALVMVGQQVQSCIVQQTFAQPVYQQGYQQGYANQVYDVRTIIVPTEKVEDVYLGLVGQAQRAAERQAQAQQATASADQKIDRLTALVEALQKRLETQASEPALPSHPGQQVPSPPLPSVGPSAEAAPPAPTIAQASASVPARKGNGPGLALLSAKCAGCHTGASQKGRGYQIFATDGSLAKLDRVSLENIDAEIASGRMPKASTNLTLREYVTVRDFLAEQASSLALNTTNQRKKPL